MKVTLPSPLMLSLIWSPKFSAAAYPDPFVLMADAVDLIRQEVREVAALGCTYIQIDAPELATLVDPTTRQRAYEAQGVSTERMLGEGIDMLNAVADASGVTFALHMCRGNNAGMWMAEGGYDAISKQVFRRAGRYDIFSLEYDDERSGGFEPLRDVPSDKRVVLGLISTKTDRLESVDELTARVDSFHAISSRCRLSAALLRSRRAIRFARTHSQRSCGSLWKRHVASGHDAVGSASLGSASRYGFGWVRYAISASRSASLTSVGRLNGIVATPFRTKSLIA
jgi:methionine synthase II (cobalamin-independent)